MTMEATVATVLGAALESVAATNGIRQLTTLNALAGTAVLTAAPESIATTNLTNGFFS